MADQPSFTEQTSQSFTEQAGVHLPPVPVTEQDIATAPREERRSVKKMSQFIWKQYQNGISARQHHAVAWIMVKSFMRGIHYFEIDGTGAWRPIPPTPGVIRAAVPVMKPMFRHVLGFLNSNELSVAVRPMAGSANPIYKSERSQDILHHWRDETRFQDVYDRGNQVLLTEGMFAYHWFRDKFRENMFVKILPQSELFPIPYDARDPSELHGLTHATIITRQWAELQDELFEREFGRKPNPSMASKVKHIRTGMSTSNPLGGSFGAGGKIDGALALTTWMRKNETVPSGEYMFMLGDEAFRHIIGNGPDGRPATESIMPDGELPVEFVYYDKDPSDFWGYGLCESQIPAQLSINRQVTSAERAARRNKGLLFVDPTHVDIKDIQDEDSPAIPIKPRGMDLNDKRQTVEYFPQVPIGRDPYALINISREFADSAAGFRSGIPFGVQEGRTEGGPATGLLHQNAFSSTNSVLRRQSVSLNRLWPHVLDGVRFVWPKGKVIKVTGPGNMGREFKVQQDNIPWSSEVIIKTAPLLSGGAKTFASILFQLKEIPGQDGKPGTEITSEEFRRGLMELNLLPPGVDAASRPETRIRTRINLLINDGQNPAIRPADPSNPNDRMVLENHRLAIEMFKDVILDESWNAYGPNVQKALLMEAEFHRSLDFGAAEAPNNFDDDGEKLASFQLEEFLAAAEADLETSEGEFESQLAGVV